MPIPGDKQPKKFPRRRRNKGPKANPKTISQIPGGRVRPTRGKRQSTRGGAVDSGLQVVKNPLFSSNSQTSDGVRTIDIVCDLTPASLMRVINSWVQYYVTISGNTLIAGNDTTDYQDMAATLYGDLVNSLLGVISLFVANDQPQIYRDLYEAISPKTTRMSPTVQTRYSWNLQTIPGSFVETDFVHWGPQTQTEYFSTGQGIVGPFAGNSVNFTVVKKLFNAMLAKGHKKWDGKPTAYATDTTAFAMYEPDNNSSSPSDFANGAGMIQHEQPIRSVWTGALQLCGVSNDRFPRFFKAVYAGPQTYMGHRLLNILRGQEGAMEQCTIQRVDYTEFQYQVQGIINGLFTNTSASSGDSIDPLAFFFNLIENTAWTLYLMNCIASAALMESPATLGYLDPFSTYFPLPFGTQFIPRDPSGTSVNKMFILVVENLRRLKVVATQLGRVGDMYFYNAFSASPQLFTTFPIPGTSAWPASYIITSSTDSVSGEIVSINSSGTDAIATNFTALIDFMGVAAACTKISDQTAEREMGNQQLTNLLRFVAPTPAAKLLAQPLDVLKRSNSKKEGVRLAGHQLRIFQSMKPRKYFKPMFLEEDPITAAFPIVIGTQGAVGSRRPLNVVANKFFSCVLPITYVQLAPVGGTLMNAISPAVTKLSVYAFSPVDSVLSSYYNNINNQGMQTTYRAESSTTPIELLQLFQNRADAGLGGAAGDLTRMLFGFAKKDKWKKIGDKLAPVVDGIVNAFPKTKKLNNAFGGGD